MKLPFLRFGGCSLDRPGTILIPARVILLSSSGLPSGLVTDLAEDGFELVHRGTVVDFMSLATNGSFDLLLIDSVACGSATFEMAQCLAHVPEISKTPVIFYAMADAGEPHELGDCTEFIAAPLDSEELRLRMHAAVRRRAYSTQRRILAFADIELDLERYLVRRQGSAVRLSQSQVKLLRYLMEHPQTILSRRQLLEVVWGDSELEEQTVTVMIVRLRKLLGQIGRPDLIKTVRPAGYVLER